jgi:multidrug resistance efflux pump
VLRAWLIWLAILTAAFLLYITGSSSVDSLGVAQPKEHKVAVTHLGRLGTLEVREGALVRKGQLLARMDVAEIEAQLAVARADLDKTLALVPAASVHLASDSFATRRGLLSELEQADTELAALAASTAREQAELQAVVRELNQEQELLSRGLVRADHANVLVLRKEALEQSVRGAPARMHAVQRRASAARDRVRDWDHLFSVRGAGAGHRGENSSDARTARLLPLEAGVQEKRVIVENLEQKRRQAEVTAPVDGYVQNIVVREGDVIQPGSPIITLVERTATQIIAYASERLWLKLDTGQQVSVLSRSSGNGFMPSVSARGVVTGVAGSVTLLPNRVWANPHIPMYGREVYIRLTDAVEFSPGESLEVRFGAGAAAGAPVAPTAPLAREAS